MATAKQAPTKGVRYSKLYPHLVLPAEAEEYPDLNPDIYPPLAPPKDWTKLQCGYYHVTPDIVKSDWFQATLREENAIRDSNATTRKDETGGTLTGWQAQLGEVAEKRQWCCIESWQFAKDKKLNNAHNRAKMLGQSDQIILVLASFGHNPDAYRWYDYNKNRSIDQCMTHDYKVEVKKLGLEPEDLKIIAASTRWLNLFHECEPLNSRLAISRSDRLDTFGVDTLSDADLRDAAEAIYRDPEGSFAAVASTWLELKKVIERAPYETKYVKNKAGKSVARDIQKLPMRETLLLVAMVLGSNIIDRKGAAEEFMTGIILGEKGDMPRSESSPIRHCYEQLMSYRDTDNGKIDYKASGAELLIITLAYMREFFDGYNNKNQSFKGNPIEIGTDGRTRFVSNKDYVGLMFAGRRWEKRLVGGVPRLSVEEDNLYSAKIILLRQQRRTTDEIEAEAETIGDSKFAAKAVGLTTPVEDAGFNKTTVTLLKQTGLDTVGDVTEMTDVELYTSDFNAAKVNHIKEILGGYGFHLAK